MISRVIKIPHQVYREISIIAYQACVTKPCAWAHASSDYVASALKHFEFVPITQFLDF